jgi:multiple sugar transport system permease protein
MINNTVAAPVAGSGSFMIREMRKFMATATVTLFTLMVLVAYLSPFAYSLSTSLKTRDQISAPKTPLWPAVAASFEYEGVVYDVYNVPTDAGMEQWALVKKGRQNSQFLDPANPEAGLIEWEGKWRALDPAWEASPQWQNYLEAWNLPGFGFTFGRLIWNTFAIGIL